MRDPCIFYVHGQYIRYAENSLYTFSNKSRLRYEIVKFVTSKYFNYFIILLIFVYSVLLGAKDYTDVNNESEINQFLHKIDPYFNIIIYVEFLLKIVAMGFVIGEGTYMSDPWNWIDFVVVFSSLLELTLSTISNGDNFKMPSALRAIRLLRPLKLLN